MRDLALRQSLAERGVFFPTSAILAHDSSPEQQARWNRWSGDWRLAAAANPALVSADLRGAMDSQPGLVTTPNAGVPALFASIVDPEVIRVIFTPMRAAEIMGGETQKGDWTTQVMYFPIAENVGQVATYNDYSNNGAVDVNPNWVPRQPYPFQTFKRYGEKLLAQWGAAGLNYSSELDASVALVFGKFMNKSYFYGIAGLINYGLINDPALLPPITPLVKANTSQGVTWKAATALEVFNDFQALFAQLVLQTGGNIDMDETMTLALSTNRMPSLVKTNDFGITVEDMVKKAFPNLTVKAAPEYSTGSGEFAQLIVPKFEGQQTAYPAYTEKLREHALVTEPSAWSQKVSAGTFGAIVRRPICIASMLGI